MLRMKISVLGPSKSGKTCISNFLSNDVVQFGSEYQQTKGVRILEFEMQNLKIDGKNIHSEIEMWDCSGGMKCKQFWPVFWHKTDGFLFVYDSDNVNDTKELKLFLDYFVFKQDTKLTHCIIFDNKKGKNKKNGKALSEKYSQINQTCIDTEDDFRKIKDVFKDFLINIITGIQDVKEEEFYAI